MFTDRQLTFYPAYCYSASLTYFVWVKLAAHDIHYILRTRSNGSNNHTHRSSTGNPLYFYLNHPIQFVQLTGIVVAIEDFHPHIFLFTLDDSSGSTIDVVWRKPKPQSQSQNDYTTTTLTTAEATAKVKTQRQEREEDEDEEQQQRREDADTPLLPLLNALEIGTTVLAKGTLSPFRHTLQLNLLRLTVLTPTQELRLIQSRTSFLLNTLSKPWRLSANAQTRLLKKASGERVGENERAARARKRREQKEKREKADAEEIERVWEEEETLRARLAEVARQDGMEVMQTIQERRALKEGTKE